MEGCRIRLPAGVDFTGLKLRRGAASGEHAYDRKVLTKIIAANGFGQQTLIQRRDLELWIISECYLAHRAGGGAPDSVAEDILASVLQAGPSNIPTQRDGAADRHD